jgi:PAS domain S-box-containing protein
MYSRYKNLGGKPHHLFLVGLGLAVLYWAFDAAIDFSEYGGAGFLVAFLTPRPHDLAARLLFVGFLFLFICYVNFTIRKRDLLTEALKVATVSAEEAQARSEAIIAAVGDGLSIQDTEFRVLYQNDNHKELVGGDFSGKFCYEAYNCRDRVCPDCPMFMCYRDGLVHKVERLVSERAKYSYVEITASPLRDASGRIVAGIEIVRDMSQRRENEEALKRQSRFLQQLIDTIPSPVFYKDANYRFMGCNAAFEACIGLARGQVIGKTFHEFLPKEQADLFHMKDVELFEHPGIQVYEAEISCATGCRRNVIFNKATFTGTDGDLAGMVGVVVDITERKQVETRLKESEVRFRNLVESTSDWVWEVDAQGVYTYASPRIRNLMGYEPEDIIGKTPFDFMPPDEAERIAAIFAELVFARKPFSSLVNINLHKDGRLIVLDTSGIPIFDNEGAFCGYRGIDRDITERKRIEEEIRKLNNDLSFRAAGLVAANRELEAFSYSVSHDLRSPLTRIYSAGQLVKEMYSSLLDETGRTLVQTICDGCHDMEELIETLLTLSRVTSSKMNRTECDLSKLAEIIVAELQVTEPERSPEFAIEPGLFDYGDPRLIRVLLENLLANAWKYTRKTPEAQITFGATDIDGERVYYVRDNGAGFDMEKSDRLFKPFQRLHNNGDFKGTGIGLATVRRIVERHGGRVWGAGVVGRGATFFFTLR